MSEIGYHGTGVKKILDVMQVPKGSFYNYFASKEAFVADVVKEYGRELINELDESIVKNVLSAVNQLRIILDDSIENYESLGCRRGCLIGSLAAELGGQSSLCQEALQQVVNEWELRTAALLSRGQQAGEIRTDLRADQLANIFWSCWEGGLMRMKLEGKSEPLRDMAALLLNTLLRP